jgi:hypothetical protein
MTDHSSDNGHENAPDYVLIMRIGQAVASLAALYYVASADYPLAALGGIVAIFFVIYICWRMLFWFNSDRFTPNGFRVGVLWAVAGIDPDTREYDTGPVITYLSFMAVLFVGILLRPFIAWIF